MTSVDERGSEAARQAADELSTLLQQTELARVALTRLEEDLVCADRRLGSAHSTQLREANEQLVIAMLRAHTEADIATTALAGALLAGQIDALTALPNRTLLTERFSQALRHAEAHSTKVAVLFLDLNDFHRINAAHGHGCGDAALRLVAGLLTIAIGRGDTVCRYGGDEFLILLPHVRGVREALGCAARINSSLELPVSIAQVEARLSASIGVSIYPDDGTDMDALINHADASMRHARSYGLGTSVFQGATAPGAAAAARGASIELQHAQLREANEQLVLAALNAQELQTAAQEAHRLQTKFLAVLAHELRNPLAPIRTTAALIGRVQASELPRLQAIIERQVKHLTRLVADLFDVSRVQTGKLLLELADTDMSAIIAEAIDTCRPAMDKREQQFGVYVAARAMPVHADGVRLSQVLINLLDNASKYTPVGGEIRLSAVVVGSNLVLTVSDNGIGIPASAISKVFDPFVQDPRAVGFNSDGLGLGLTVVRELIDAHGGSVSAQSAGSGLGSQFVISLPLSA